MIKNNNIMEIIEENKDTSSVVFESDEGTKNSSYRLRTNSINGVSLTDGNGLTNGNGITIGNGIEERNLLSLKVRRTKRSYSNPIIIGTIVVVILLILTSILVISKANDKDEILIDGEFKDWDDVYKYQDINEDIVKNNNINIIEYSTKTNELYLYLYLKVEGIMLAGTNTSMDMVQIFIDTDKTKGTGYLIEDLGIGADYMIEISGRYNSIESGRYYEFDNDRENNDWNAWESMFTVDAICMESELEIKVWLDDLSISKSDKILVYFHTFDINDNHDFSDLLISNEKGALGVDVINTLEEFLEPGKTYNALTLKMNVKAADIKINAITLEKIGTAEDSDIESVTINSNGKKINGVFKEGEITLNPSMIYLPFSSQKDRDMSVIVAVELATTATSTHTVGLKIKSIELASGAVTIKQQISKLSYISNPTDEIVIDGGFRDWDNLKPHEDNKGDVSNPNVDIIQYNSITNTNYASFYLKVDGRMMAGVGIPARTRSISVPTIKQKESTDKPSVKIGTQEKQPLPTVTGDDKACIFLDMDRNKETGFPVLNGIFGADYMIKIKGQSGNIKSEYHKYNNDKKEWKKSNEGKPTVACDAKQLEAQIEMKELNNVNEIDVYFHIIDWKGNEDYSDTPIKGKVVSIASSRAVFLEIDISPGECNPDEIKEYDFTIKDTDNSGDDKKINRTTIYTPVGFSITGATAPTGHDGDGGSWSVTIDYVDDYATFTYSEDYGDARTDSVNGLSGFKVTATAPSEEDTYTWTVYAADFDSEGEGDMEEISTSVVPEFSDIFIPIIGVIGLFLIFKRKKDNKSKRRG